MSVKREPLDIIFSKVIRESYDYQCCACDANYRHDPGYMHCAHIHTRKHRSTRWNSHHGAIALCAKCHRRFTDFPLEWADFLKRFMGESNYDEAKRLAWQVRKYTKAEKKEMLEHYKAQLKYLERQRGEGATGTLPVVSWD